MVPTETTTEAIDWQRLVPASWELINRQAQRRFGATPLAEEAALAVMDGLLDNGARRLQSYRGRGTSRAFLAAVSWRLLEDFARKRYGRRQPPRWIRHLGGIWEKLYTLLCLERLDIMDAVMAISAASGAVQAQVEEAAWSIRQHITDCGAHQGLEVELDEQQVSAHQGAAAAEGAEVRQRRALFQQLFMVLTDLSPEQSAMESEKLAGLTFPLTPDERLLLRLCFVDELSVTQAGEMLGLNRFQAHGRLRRLLARIRDVFRRAGVDGELLELLAG